MIKKEHRFHRRNDIKHVYKSGRTVRVEGLTLKYVSRKSDNSSRLAVVVSKKTAKSAVVRNRIRRRIYEIARKNWSEIDNLDMVISVFDASLANIEHDKLEAKIIRLFKSTKHKR